MVKFSLHIRMYPSKNSIYTRTSHIYCHSQQSKWTLWTRCCSFFIFNKGTSSYLQSFTLPTGKDKMIIMGKKPSPYNFKWMYQKPSVHVTSFNITLQKEVVNMLDASIRLHKKLITIIHKNNFTDSQHTFHFDVIKL